MTEQLVVDVLVLSEGELVKLTGYHQPSKQLAELHRLGFTRARRGRLGNVILERVHYEAVCRGLTQPSRPQVKPPRLRVA